MNKGQEFKVLDKGFVRYIDHMGTDQDIVKAARISYGKMDENRSIEEDRNLIRYMLSGAYEMKCPHSSPFEQCELKVHVKIPMDAWRQMVRHRTANINEYSTRYTEAIDDKQTTDPNEWRSQSKSNKQGSGDFLAEWPEAYSEGIISEMSPGVYLSSQEKAFHEAAEKLYKSRLALNVAKEQARKDLPLSTYTEVIWKIDLHNLMHFLKLRMDSHAQLEIRSYANAIASIAKELWPITYEAFEDYTLQSVIFSRQELVLLKELINSDVVNMLITTIVPSYLSNKREQEAFKNKIRKILDENS